MAFNDVMNKGIKAIDKLFGVVKESELSGAEALVYNEIKNKLNKNVSVADLKKDLDKEYEDIIGYMKDPLASFKSMVDTDEPEYVELNNRIVEAKKGMDTAYSLYDNHRKTNLAKAQSTYDKALSDYNEALSKYENELALMDKSFEDKENKREADYKKREDDYNLKIAKKREFSSCLKSEIEYMNYDLEKKNNVIILKFKYLNRMNQDSQDFKDLSNEISILKKEYESIRKNIEKKTKEYKKLDNEVEAFEKDVDDIKKAHDENEIKLKLAAEQKKEQMSLKKSLDEKKAALDTANKALSVEMQKNNRLESEYKSANSNHNTLIDSAKNMVISKCNSLKDKNLLEFQKIRKYERISEALNKKYYKVTDIAIAKGVFEVKQAYSLYVQKNSWFSRVLAHVGLGCRNDLSAYRALRRTFVENSRIDDREVNAYVEKGILRGNLALACNKHPDILAKPVNTVVGPNYEKLENANDEAYATKMIEIYDSGAKSEKGFQPEELCVLADKGLVMLEAMSDAYNEKPSSTLENGMNEISKRIKACAFTTSRKNSIQAEIDNARKPREERVEVQKDISSCEDKYHKAVEAYNASQEKLDSMVLDNSVVIKNIQLDLEEEPKDDNIISTDSSQRTKDIEEFITNNK